MYLRIGKLCNDIVIPPSPSPGNGGSGLTCAMCHTVRDECSRGGCHQGLPSLEGDQRDDTATGHVQPPAHHQREHGGCGMWVWLLLPSLPHSPSSVIFLLPPMPLPLQKELAANITLEQGKTLPDAEGDVLRGLRTFQHPRTMHPHCVHYTYTTHSLKPHSHTL